MPTGAHSVLVALSLTFVAVAAYHRISAARSGEKLDRTREGWPILISLRLTGLVTVGTSAAWLWNPAWFRWATVPRPDWVGWIGVGGFAFGIALLIWMFITLGRNLTDTVVTRRDAHFIDHGPYRYVRNPMYTGILIVGLSLGPTLGTWLIPLGASVVFSILAIRTRTEEYYLILRFGGRYRGYMTRVGRFFPRLA
jgi:protein-S-isoprenylcysteine O-methyltransferase Ste14